MSRNAPGAAWLLYPFFDYDHEWDNYIIDDVCQALWPGASADTTSGWMLCASAEHVFGDSYSVHGYGVGTILITHDTARPPVQPREVAP